VRFGIPGDLVARIQQDTGIRYAVETGTFLGGSSTTTTTTTTILARIFVRVWSIESSREYLEAAQQTLVRSGCADTVRLVHGESTACLGQLLRCVDGPALFWLDGHWSPWMPIDSRPQCPLLPELAAIADWPHASTSVLLIDDMSVFRERSDDGQLRPDEWPTPADLTSRLADRFGDHDVREVDDVLLVQPAQ